MLKETRLFPVQDFHTFPRHFTYKYAAKISIHFYNEMVFKKQKQTTKKIKGNKQIFI